PWHSGQSTGSPDITASRAARVLHAAMASPSLSQGNVIGLTSHSSLPQPASRRSPSGASTASPPQNGQGLRSFVIASLLPLFDDIAKLLPSPEVALPDREGQRAGLMFGRRAVDR